jgi:hypothetical protein
MTFRSPLFLAVFLFSACGGEPGTNITTPEGSSGGSNAPPTTSEEAAPPDGSPVTLDVTVDGVGTVRSEPPGIDCANQAPAGHCSATFEPTTKVTLTMTAGEGWKHAGWSGGGCSGSASTCSLNVDQANTKVTTSLKLIDPRWDPSVGANDCSDAWGTAGEKLSPCDTTPDDYVVVHKSKRNVALCKNGALVKNFRSGLGFAPAGTKEKQGDGKTPEGVFYVPRLVPNSSYYKAFLLSYPTPEDAKRGAATGMITSAQRAQIEGAHTACTEPSQSTKLGGELEVHGSGSSEDWTHGCVALDNTGIDLLWSTIGVHDTIVVLP